MKSYLLRIGDAVSQLLNVALFLGEDANESISGRSYRLRNEDWWGWMYWGIDAFFSWFGQEDHCLKAYLADLSRASKTLRRHGN